MNRRNALGVLAGTLICSLCRANAVAPEGLHWSYEGRNGPAKWAALNAANKACSIGSQQSPIDIDETISAQLAPLKIDWADAADTIGNNGHTIQLDVANGSTLTLDDTKYKLLQFHFHRPSEHTIGGKEFAMEAHFVHRADSGALAVIGVLMMAGSSNAAFSRIVATMPAYEGPPVKPTGGSIRTACFRQAAATIATPARSRPRPVPKTSNGCSCERPFRYRRLK
jgi:carbonic anhydrase